MNSSEELKLVVSTLVLADYLLEGVMVKGSDWYWMTAALVPAAIMLGYFIKATRDNAKISVRLDAIDKNLERLADIPERLAAVEAKVDHIDECIHRIDRRIDAC